MRACCCMCAHRQTRSPKQTQSPLAGISAVKMHDEAGFRRHACQTCSLLDVKTQFFCNTHRRTTHWQLSHLCDNLNLEALLHCLFFLGGETTRPYISVSVCLHLLLCCLERPHSDPRSFFLLFQTCVFVIHPWKDSDQGCAAHSLSLRGLKSLPQLAPFLMMRAECLLLSALLSKQFPHLGLPRADRLTCNLACSHCFAEEGPCKRTMNAHLQTHICSVSKAVRDVRKQAFSIHALCCGVS